MHSGGSRDHFFRSVSYGFLITELRTSSTLDYPLKKAKSQTFSSEEDQRNADRGKGRTGDGSQSDALLEHDVREREKKNWGEGH